jgi:hypothetical protein
VRLRLAVSERVKRAARLLGTEAPQALPEDAAGLEHMRRHDSVANESSKLPEGEGVSLKCLWMFDAYTAVEADQLIVALSSHRWLKDEMRSDESPSEWLRSARRSSWGGSWTNFGWISREKHFFARQGPLPVSVDTASIQLWSLTPSLTVLGVMFRISETVSQEITSVLNTNAITTTEAVGLRARHYVDVGEHKRRRTQQIRERLRADCSQWFDTYFPGVFSIAQPPPLSTRLWGRKSPAKHPTAEAWEINVAEPYGIQEMDSFAPTFLQILGMTERWNVWELSSDHFPKVRLDMPNHDDSRVMVFATNKVTLLETPKGGLEEVASLEGATYWLGDGVARLVISMLFEHYWTAITAIRDSLFARSDGKISREIERLRGLQQQLAKISHTVPRVTAEVLQFTEERWTKTEAGDFKQLEPHPNATEPSLLMKNLRQTLQYHAPRLREFLNDVSASANAAGTLINARASDEAAKTGLRIQWASLGAAVLALIVAGLSLWVTLRGHR